MSREPKVRVELDPDEKAQSAWVASIPFKRFNLAKEGGTLVLTDRRLLFQTLPLPMAAVDEIHLVRSRIKWSAPLSEIDSVQPVAGKPQQLQVSTTDGGSRRFIVVEGRTTSVRSKDSAKRDEAVEKIGAALG